MLLWFVPQPGFESLLIDRTHTNPENSYSLSPSILLSYNSNLHTSHSVQHGYMTEDLGNERDQECVNWKATALLDLPYQNFIINLTLRGSFQKKCTLWQHRLTNGAIGPANSAVILENVWKLVQCVSPPGSVCTSKRQRWNGGCSCLRYRD